MTGEQDGGVERLGVTDPVLDEQLRHRLLAVLREALPETVGSVPVELGDLVLYRDLLHGGAALSVRIRGLTLTAAWDGSESSAETLVDSAAWNYIEQVRDEDRLDGNRS